jgi:2-dehydro-3-deoxyphosphogluconate aldolase/(4S)-4-hydroxy-2-oxoglutarate aldolase
MSGRPALAGVVAIIRLREAEPGGLPDELLDALVEGGVRVIEATIPTPGALAAISRWSGRDDVLVGAGTVRTPDDVGRAADAGARFLVTPAADVRVIEAARQRELPVLAGALTPTEIEVAHAAGATMVKVFPVETVGGPAYVRAVRAPLDDIPLAPTGGVTPAAAEEYARLGCAAVGVGSALVSAAAVRDRDWSGVTERARAFAEAWRRGSDA